MLESSSVTGRCPCGSGLSQTRCCDVAPVLRRNPAQGPAATLLSAAKTALKRGDQAGAADLAVQLLEDDPLVADALLLLGDVRKNEGAIHTAAVLYDRAAKVSQDFKALNSLAMLELSRGALEPAEQAARMAVRVSPHHAQAHNLMAMVMTELHRAAVGEYHCRKALELLAPSRPALALANLATNLFNQGQIAEARALYRESDEAAPHVRQTLLAWARLEEADRQLDAATALLDRLDQLAPDDPAVNLVRANVLRRQGRYDDALSLLEDIPQRRTRPLRPVERLERGRLLDRLGRYDEAWAEFADGKARLVQVTGRSYPEQDVRAFADSLKRMFTRNAVAMAPRVDGRSDIAQPLFILGFPRSGTTLLEQTLSGSPEISAGDELPLVHALAELTPRLLNSPLPYPEAMADLWMGDHRDGLDEMRDIYLRRAQNLGVIDDGARWFTDKMPLNEMHLGLIAMMFPASPLLHVIRHPLDIMVSAMSNLFTHGAFCSYSLESAAKHLVLSHEMVEHYRAEMDLNYRQVRYEDMVDNQAETVAGVFDFIGATFDPAVLKFDSNTRYARTASYQQVTEKLYDRSRYRYRHYRKHLEPAVTILRPLIEKLGYAVD